MLSSRCGKPSPSIPLRKRKGEGKRRCTRVHSPPPARRGFTFVFSLRNEGGRRAAAGGCSRHDAGSHPPRSPFASEGGPRGMAFAVRLHPPAPVAVALRARSLRSALRSEGGERRRTA